MALIFPQKDVDGIWKAIKNRSIEEKERAKPWKLYTTCTDMKYFSGDYSRIVRLAKFVCVSGPFWKKKNDKSGSVERGAI